MTINQVPLAQAVTLYQVPEAGVGYDLAFEETLVAREVGWQAYHDAPPSERAVMIASYRTQNTLEAVLMARATKEAKAKAAEQAKKR